MQVVRTVTDWRAALAGLERPLGLVTTMGALHAGHRSLVEAARAECAGVGATIFVNPRQFAPTEDLARYPRPLDADLALLEAARADVVFVPDVGEMYPDGFATTVRVGGPADAGLEATARPGHFEGVATVVTKLLLQAGADRAYFGRKDAQQAAVIRRLVVDLDIPSQVVVCPTVREPDGLALSSRNVYLTPAQRAAAPALYRALSAGRDRYRSGFQQRERLEAATRGLLEAEQSFDAVEYVAAVDADTFAPLQRGPGLLVAAVRLGGVRLIDNVVLD
ncbi:MAG: pantoate--beta-alanine ligase [Chloroflexota bacterium]